MIIGLTLVRNEQDIIKDTLDHMALFCDKIYVYDDCSDDQTVEICKSHPEVNVVIQGTQWSLDRTTAETHNRNTLLDYARVYAGSGDWFVYMDADERIDYDFSRLSKLPRSVAGVRMKLFDYYITTEDVDLPYTQRRYIGPEYRTILMAYRNSPNIAYRGIIAREPSLKGIGQAITEGYVKHYGKAISVKQWEHTCDFYSTYFPPEYSVKWTSRKGKAVHTMSSFGNKLITWEDKHLGFPLTREIEIKNIYS